MSSSASAGLLELVGMSVGLCLTLALFALLMGNRGLARLAQHLLVGATLGYLAVLLWQEILQPRLLLPLWRDPGRTPWLWPSLGLGLLLWAGGIEALLRQAQPTQPGPLGWRRWLHWAALLPVALLVGVSLAVGLIGVIQGSLLPQLWRTIGMGIDWAAPPGDLLSRLITLLVTTATLVALTVGRADRLARPPTLLYTLLNGWIGLGKRALWLAAGAVFARLVASHLSLLIGQVNYWLTTLIQLGLWPQVERLWQ